MDIYHDIILDHYRHPRNFGILPTGSITAREVNIGCGDEIAVYLGFDQKRWSITAFRWQGRGCAISTAAASILSERIGQIRRISQIRQITDADILEMLGGQITPTRHKCATLALVALRQALGQLKVQNQKLKVSVSSIKYRADF